VADRLVAGQAKASTYISGGPNEAFFGVGVQEGSKSNGRHSKSIERRQPQRKIGQSAAK
jgi:hypothetical protein